MAKDGPLYTFGDTQAAITLYKILANDEKALCKASRILSQINHLFNSLDAVQNKHDHNSLLHILHKSQQERAAKIDGLPRDAYSFLRNVINTKFKIKLRET